MSKSKTEVVIYSHGLRYCIEIWYGMRIDFDLLKREPSLNLKTKVDLRRHGRHLKNRYNVITLSGVQGHRESFLENAKFPRQRKSS